MNLPPHPPCLYKWTCPECGMTIRTRLWDMTIGEGRLHSYNSHRTSPAIVPVACLWDPRIVGKRWLYTRDR